MEILRLRASASKKPKKKNAPTHFVEKSIVIQRIGNPFVVNKVPAENGDNSRGLADRIRCSLRQDGVLSTKPGRVGEAPATAQRRNGQIQGALLDEHIDPVGPCVPCVLASVGEKDIADVTAIHHERVVLPQIALNKSEDLNWSAYSGGVVKY